MVKVSIFSVNGGCEHWIKRDLQNSLKRLNATSSRCCTEPFTSPNHPISSKPILIGQHCRTSKFALACARTKLVLGTKTNTRAELAKPQTSSVDTKCEAKIVCIEQNFNVVGWKSRRQTSGPWLGKSWTETDNSMKALNGNPQEEIKKCYCHLGCMDDLPAFAVAENQPMNIVSPTVEMFH